MEALDFYPLIPNKNTSNFLLSENTFNTKIPNLVFKIFYYSS